MDISGMKKYAVYAGAGLALIVALVAFGRACRIGDAYSRLEGRYQEAMRLAKIDSEIFNKTIAEKEKAIAELDKKLITSTQVVGHLTDAIGQKDSDLFDLDAKLAAAKTDAERVPILRAEVAVWAEKFSLAEKIIAEKDDQLKAWAVKFDMQVTISETWKTRYENEARLHEISRDEISALKARLISTRLVGTLKSGLIVAAVGYLGYQAIKGD